MTELPALTTEEQQEGLWRNCEDSIRHALQHFSDGANEVDDFHRDEGLAMLTSDGTARVIELAVPGPNALATTHPFFSVVEMRSKGELPNLVRQFVQTWAFRHARPGYQTRTMELDCGLFFRTNVPADWIVAIDTLSH